jgi:predicted AlkP superfamily phosphohydrolase/phosphomutase
VKAPKILFIGIDAGEPRLILEWSRAGVLPVFRSLLETAAWGTVTSPPGFVHDPTWCSVNTGLSPARHGHFFVRQMRRGSYRTFPSSPSSFEKEPFWSALGRAGRRVAILDVPYAPAPEHVNGIQLVDWTTHYPFYRRVRSWPPGLAAEVTARYGANPVPPHDLVVWNPGEYRGLCDRLLKRVAMKADVSCQYLDRGGWDLFMTVFGESHCGGHYFWHLHDPTHPRHDPDLARSLGDPLRDIYVALDTAVGRLLERAGPESTVFLFTGPGMGPNYGASFLLDDVLRRIELGSTARRPGVLEPLKASYRRLIPGRLYRRLIPLADLVDDAWRARERRRRKFFALPHADLCGAIRINLVGREPDGRVHPGPEREQVTAELTRDLLALVDLETGEPVVQKVIRTADLYQGEYLDDLPDLLVMWNKQFPISGVGSSRVGEVRGVYIGPRSGDHTPDGLIAARGPMIRPGELGVSVAAVDLAPTMAAILGVDLSGVDGTPVAALGAGPRSAG